MCEIEKLLNEQEYTINPFYDARAKDIAYLYNNFANDIFALIDNTFKFGYIQGKKAALAELKKKHPKPR